LAIGYDLPLAFGAAASGGSKDVYLYRDAANTLAQRNTSATQKFSIYNTTDGTNYERGFLSWQEEANVFYIGTESGGTGSARGILINPENNILELGTSTTFSLDALRGIAFRHTQDLTVGDGFTFGSNGTDTEMVDTNAAQAMVGVYPRVAQSGTAAFDAILVDTLEEAFGDGSTGDGNNLLRLASLGTTVLKVDVNGTTEMNKGTDDAAFIDFVASADADATSAISTLTTSGAVTHHIQISINGVTAWIPCSTTDPT
jgi:hypothetical protein